MPKRVKKVKKPPAELGKIHIEPPWELFAKFQRDVEADIKEMEESGFKERMFKVKSDNLKRIAVLDVKLKAFSRKYIWDHYGKPNTLYPPQDEIDKDQALFKEKNRLYKEYQSMASKYFGRLRARKVWIEINAKRPRAQGEKDDKDQ